MIGNFKYCTHSMVIFLRLSLTGDTTLSCLRLLIARCSHYRPANESYERFTLCFDYEFRRSDWTAAAALYHYARDIGTGEARDS